MYWNKWDQYPLEALLYGILALVPFAFCELGWILLAFNSREKLSRIRRKGITQKSHSLENFVHARRAKLCETKIWALYGHIKKDLVEGKFRWRRIPTHYGSLGRSITVIKFYLEKDRQKVLANEKNKVKTKKKKNLSSPENSKKFKPTIQGFWGRSFYGDDTKKDFQLNGSKMLCSPVVKNLNQRLNSQCPCIFHKHFPLPSVIPANSSVLKKYAQELGMLSSKKNDPSAQRAISSSLKKLLWTLFKVSFLDAV